MNKYENAIDIVARYCSDVRSGITPRTVLTNELDILMELVEKATPKKVIETYDYRVTICPNCEEMIDADVEYYSRVYANKGKETYCIHCGQVLDWSAKGELDD